MTRIDKDEKRLRILTAAREIFEETGKIDVGLRAIAARTNQTTGGIYNHFKGKDEILAALLGQSLDRLFRAVSSAAHERPDNPAAALRASATAFLDHYRTNQFEQKLGLYQFESEHKTGFGKHVDTRLNSQLSQTVKIFEELFFALSGNHEKSQDNAAALFSALIGISMMATLRRDQSLGTNAENLLDTILSNFLSNQ
ncbi:TetR/AcrR family transcriptional regulator [Pseudovibrio sp. Tun.PSC04-5.I4]|uniref:TetR/AcrR family transcriptional regulator n=1 Tax=Pseudovibrio sp. Tun.PSC04-5.I4 TaxID=1798213 RepID=UPI00088D6239|nr:TetR/AcrR family transcriptional regulator [Pseudovibrio sp. Tun.PSC04-5.I4]SDR48033.1 DNA-binding transcriptional regulator, AcrR family [Pseudovibrio sp. Tun.PSC04-5.I4]